MNKRISAFCVILVAWAVSACGDDRLDVSEFGTGNDSDGGCGPATDGGGGSGGDHGVAGGGVGQACAGYFNPDAIWCIPVEDRPLAPQSAEATAATGNWGMEKFQIDFSIVLTTLDESNPGTLLAFQETGDFYSPDCDHTQVPFPLDGSGSLEGEAGWDCVNGGDCHAVILDSQSGFLYEQWRALNPGSANPYQGGCLRRWQPAMTTGSLPSDIQCTSAIADGQPLWPMMLTPDEVLNDGIDHALRFILPNSKIAQHLFVYPATHSTGPTSLPPPALPYGSWLRLKWTDEQIDQWVQGNKPGNVYLGRILRALRRHGMILSDGGNVALTWASDSNRQVKWAEVGIDSHSLIGTPPILPTDFDWIVPPGVDPADFHTIPMTNDCTRVPLDE